MKPTARDCEILRLIHEHRFLRSSQIVALLAASSQPVVRRLQLLYHHGYLERPRCQIDYYHHGGSRKIVYGLTDKGARLLRQTGITVRSERISDENRDVGRVYLEHVLFVAEVMVAVESACRTSGVRLLKESDLGIKSTRWSVQVNAKLKFGVIPDRIFGLESANSSGTTTRAYFFFEADRGTMPIKRINLFQSSIYRKLLCYQASWQQGLHTRVFNFHRFRVLTVTKSALRLEAMVKACSRLEHALGLFLFSDRGILDGPERILTARLHTGKVGKTATLLD